ncbi:uncharacterized protein LOC100831283 [Brachypodium distachyon]|uniref:Uncharacterized protein n=1 Tax=Brachypodium distachyon TaxID=15368 RepID=A0A0Q3N6P8_BRADI|nr:uncharacterized protein LOC100831283 [Brachypodium distachyon]KQK12358.1 hypothetical protein BRADI_1g03191v3 [Brachypodium distachyon]|eukprot:XP_014751942.1 uncharacterized protein LOC100831283 [Brachypodium distachyon]
MSVRLAAPLPASEKMTTMSTAAPAAWPYVEYMARWERQVERRQLFLRSYHFSRDADLSPRARTRRVVWAGARRLRRAAATGLRRLRARLRLCFAWATLRRRRSHSLGGFRYGRLPRAGKPSKPAASVCFW